MTTIQIQGAGTYEIPIQKNEALFSWLLENGAKLIIQPNPTTTIRNEETSNTNLINEQNSPIPV